MQSIVSVALFIGAIILAAFMLWLAVQSLVHWYIIRSIDGLPFSARGRAALWQFAIRVAYVGVILILLGFGVRAGPNQAAALLLAWGWRVGVGAFVLRILRDVAERRQRPRGLAQGGEPGGGSASGDGVYQLLLSPLPLAVIVAVPSLAVRMALFVVWSATTTAWIVKWKVQRKQQAAGEPDQDGLIQELRSNWLMHKQMRFTTTRLDSLLVGFALVILVAIVL